MPPSVRVSQGRFLPIQRLRWRRAASAFVKWRESNEVDSYDELGFHLYYDESDRLEFIEAFEPCDPIFDGVRLLDHNLGAVLGRLGELGHSYRCHDKGYDFEGLGFVLYVPLESIEAVSIYRRGYYDDLLA